MISNPWFVAMIAAGGVLWLLVTVTTRRAPRSAHAARHLAGPRDMRPLSEKAAAATAKRLGAPTPGLTIGRAVRGGRRLVQGWEACSLDVAGPRVGKTTCRVIPAILDAPGAVVTTSNKRDSLDATRDARSDRGPVWVFDPQRVAGELPSWWWNPLRAVTDEIKAGELADVFAAAVTARDAREDAFFSGKGRKVVAALLLAAAAGGRTIDQCHRWVTDAIAAEEAVGILRGVGHDLLAGSLLAELHAPEKQRGGVLGSAERLLAFLTHRDALEWVTPHPGRPELDVDAFVRSTGTIYSLSREGAGSAGALVAALTAAVLDAAERLAVESPGGRLPVPLVACLDEACNVVRIPTLPDLYSHYGSRAGSRCSRSRSPGRSSSRRSAATARASSGRPPRSRSSAPAVGEAEFLEDLSRLVGDYDRPVTSTSSARTGRSTTRGTMRARILPVDELASLPHGRAVVLAAGMPATLARLERRTA